MKSQILVCTICFETALAVFFAIGSAVSYGRAVPVSPCLKSRSAPTMLPRAVPSVPPMPPTASPKITSIAREGWATYYTRASCRREGTGGKRILMANGKPLDDQAKTVALWIVGKNGRPLRPDGRLVKITSVKDSQEVICAWADNGPGRVPRSEGVICDLTPAAFKALGGNLRDGKIKVTVEGINEG